MINLAENNLNCPCIYALYKNEEIVYIGQTISFLSRISYHIKDKDFDSFEIVDVIEDKAERLRRENQLIYLHSPYYNEDGVNFIVYDDGNCGDMDFEHVRLIHPKRQRLPHPDEAFGKNYK
jgi:hypothetical protein